MKKDMKGIAFMVIGLQAMGTAGYLLFYWFIETQTWPYEPYGIYSLEGILLLGGVIGMGIGIILFAVGAQLYLEAGREDEGLKFRYWKPPRSAVPGRCQFYYLGTQQYPRYIPPPPPGDDD